MTYVMTKMEGHKSPDLNMIRANVKTLNAAFKLGSFDDQGHEASSFIDSSNIDHLLTEDINEYAAEIDKQKSGASKTFYSAMSRIMLPKSPRLSFKRSETMLLSSPRGGNRKLVR